MWHPAKEDLDGWNVPTAFLALRWHEFFDTHSIDSFQPRVCNLAVLLEEIEDVSRRELDNGVWGKHRRLLLEEMRVAARSAAANGWTTTEEASLLDRLAREHVAAESVRIVEDLDPNSFRGAFEARVLSKTDQIADSLPRAKNTATDLLGQLATIALHRGYLESSNFDEFGAHTLPQQVRLEPRDWFGELVSSIAPVPRDFYCVLSLTAPPRRLPDLKAVARKVGFDVVKASLVGVKKLGEGELLVGTSVQALGEQAALAAALKRIEPSLNVLEFYANTSVKLSGREGWVGPDRTELAAMDLPKQRLRLINPHTKARAHTLNMLDAGSQGRIDGCIVNALELHRMGLQSDDIRTRVLNFWSALECISGVADGPNVIARICNLVLPIVGWRRIDKRVRYCAINLKMWRAATDTASREVEGLPNATDRRVPAEDMLLSLSREEFHADIMSVLDHASGHPLLCYRIFTAWQTLHNPGKLAGDLSASRHRLRWHLWRIYRVRNLLVHEGVESPLLPFVVDNLHFYFSVTISRLIHGLTLNHSWTAADSVKHWCDKAAHVESELVRNPAGLRIDDLLPNPTILRSDTPWGR